MVVEIVLYEDVYLDEEFLKKEMMGEITKTFSTIL